MPIFSYYFYNALLRNHIL